MILFAYDSVFPLVFEVSLELGTWTWSFIHAVVAGLAASVFIRRGRLPRHPWLRS